SLSLPFCLPVSSDPCVSGHAQQAELSPREAWGHASMVRNLHWEERHAWTELLWSRTLWELQDHQYHPYRGGWRAAHPPTRPLDGSLSRLHALKVLGIGEQCLVCDQLHAPTPRVRYGDTCPCRRGRLSPASVRNPKSRAAFGAPYGTRSGMYSPSPSFY